MGIPVFYLERSKKIHKNISLFYTMLRNISKKQIFINDSIFTQLCDHLNREKGIIRLIILFSVPNLLHSF